MSPTNHNDEPNPLAEQNAALEAMSEQLTYKLGLMIKEQEARAAEFTARQHSLSALPDQNAIIQELPSIALYPATPIAESIISNKLPTQQRRASAATHSIPTPPKPQQQAARSNPTATPSPTPLPRKIKPQPQPQESSIGSIPIIVGIILLILTMRACS